MKTHKTLMTVAVICLAVSCVNAAMIYADADGHSDGANISNAFAGMTLSTTGTAANLDGQVYARVPVNPVFASTPRRVFGNNLQGVDGAGSPFDEIWTHMFPTGSCSLRADFDQAAEYISIDVIGNNHSDYGIVEAYNSSGTLIGSVTTPQLTSGQVFQVEIFRSSFDISYMIASGQGGDTVYLDNLCANVPEPATMVLLGLGGLAAIRRRRHKV